MFGIVDVTTDIVYSQNLHHLKPYEANSITGNV